MGPPPLTALVRPAREQLPDYIAALQTGWSPDNLRPEVAQEQLAAIAADADAFLALADDPQARGGPVYLADGTAVPRLPSIRRWIWADGFCGSIGLRWRVPGDATLPAHVPGHIGYAVVPWRRREGHATRALALLLPEARALGLAWVELTTEPENAASRRVIESAGGAIVGRFTDTGHGGGDKLRYRIDL